MPLTPAESRVASLIAGRDAPLLADLRAFVALPTGGNNRSALDENRRLMTTRLAGLGAKIDLMPGDPRPDWLSGPVASTHIPPTAIARRAAGGKRILLCGHLDTVHDPAGPFRELAISPNGKTATGPGCVDMKGGLVIAMHALEVLEEAGFAVSWSFILNSDEETGSFHSDTALRAAAGGHDYGLCLEPAMPDGGLVVERPGSGQFMVEAHGRAAHVGRDFKSGISAVNALAERLLAIAQMPHPDRGIIVNVGPIDGGIAPNVVPDRARAWGNVRFANPDIADDLRRRLRGLATVGIESDTLGRGHAFVEVSDAFNRPSKPLTPQTQLLANLARIAAEDLGQSLPFGKTGGVCDGNNLQAEGLPTIDTLGVRGGGLHTPQEWIELASLVERCQLLAVLMMRLS